MATKQEKVAYLASISGTNLLELPYFQNRGKRFIQRCGVDDLQGKRELAFSDVIKAYHELHGIEHLTEDCESMEEVVFTTFQWLTTNVGRGVLGEAMKKVEELNNENT